MMASIFSAFARPCALASLRTPRSCEPPRPSVQHVPHPRRAFALLPPSQPPAACSLPAFAPAPQPRLLCTLLPQLQQRHLSPPALTSCSALPLAPCHRVFP